MDNDPNNNQDNQQQDLQNDIMKDDLKEGLNKAKQKKAEKENSIAHKGAEQAKKQVGTAIKNSVNKKFGSTLIKIKAKLAKIVLPAIVVIVIIVVAIGLISFFLNMPGLMIGKVSELCAAINENASLYLWGENNQLNRDNIDYEKRLELLNYISSDLGFDVIGLGFVPVAQYDEGTDPETGESNIGKQKIIDYDTQLGWKAIHGIDDKKIDPDGDLMYYYLMASERAYIQNTNGVLGALFSKNDWSGMLNIDAQSQDITVDRENKTLEIRNSDPHWGELLNEDVFTFSLDGWTGRYGTPIEFSLALHLSTMSSGMVKELITNEDLQTEVHIDLQKANCDISFKFMRDDGSTIEIPFKPTQGTISDLAEKIRNGDPVKTEDLSIRGLVYAYTNLTDKYILNEEMISGGTRELAGISRHMETMSAVLESDYFAVDYYDSSVYYDKFSTAATDAFPIYARRTFNINQAGADYLNGNYNQACGSFICKYNADGTPNTSTGMLNKTIEVESRLYDNQIDTGFDLKYELVGDDSGSYIYDLMYYDTRSNTKMDLGATVVVPKVGVVIDNGLMGAERIKGLKKAYEDACNGGFTPDDIVNIGKKDAWEAIFNEIDWFLGTTCITGNFQYYHYKWDEFYNIANSNGSNGLQLSDYYFYTNKYNEVYNALTNEQDIEKAQTDFIELMEWLIEDYNHLCNNANTKVSVDDQLNSILKNNFGANVTYEDLIKVVRQFGGNPDSDESEVVYTQPRITKVIKHWYKDVDFGNEENIAYSKTSDKISIKYTGDDIQGFTINAELTPQPDNYLYEQTAQPRVVKGETVYLDGEIIGTTDDLYGGEQPAENYRWGDGYRATKKIFTQGFYYTFDGSGETSRSIYWQQQLEDIDTAGTYTVAVSSGRIYYISPNLTPGGDHVTEHEINASDYEWPSGVNVQYVSENTGLTAGYFNGLKETDLVKFYRITISNTDSVKYLSPTDHSYEEVKTRTNQINNIWKSMGVASLRKQLSFDNASANGEVMANTGLSILKNCDSQDADYIYRDLKEMLLDLGYYTQAEFDQLDSAVLRWFIPEYMPKVWPQNLVTNFTVPAQIYPYDPEAENDELDNESDEESIDLSKQLDEGFKEDLEVIAPGDCRILSYDTSTNTIEIEFDGISEPKISALDGYKMIISGIKINETIQTEDSSGNSETHDISYYAGNENAIIKEGSVIGKTGTEVISVTLMNDIGRYISNVEDYMALPTFGNAIMLDMETEEIVAMIWGFEGVSDADGNPNDEYYQVVYSSTDAPTVGHGVTAATVATWNELGYGEYIANGKFTTDRIPKEVVDNVSKYKVQKDLEMLDGLLQQAGIEWGGNQKAAWISLYYNGWHTTVNSLIQDYADQNYASLRQKWLHKCVNTGTIYEKGHKNRRSQEWILFWTGELLGQGEAYNKCYVTGEY